MANSILTGSEKGSRRSSRSRRGRRTDGGRSNGARTSGARSNGARSNGARSTPTRRGGGLPDWGDLEPAGNRRVAEKKMQARTGLAAWPTARMLVWLAVGALLLTLYIGHVHATQALLSDVQQMRRENLQLHLRHNRLTGELDRLGGPMSVYERARELGLQDGQQVGPPITLELE